MTKCETGYCQVGVSLDCSDNFLIILEKDLEGVNSVPAFRYCPLCGHKIDWERIEKELKD